MLIILNLVLLFKVSAILIQVNGDDVVTDGEPIASPQIRFIYPFWLRPIYNSFNYEPPSQDSAAASRDLSDTSYYHSSRPAEPQFPPALVYWRRRYPTSDDMTDFHSAKPCHGLQPDAPLGKCVHSKHCGLLGGQPSGFCSPYSVCCVDKSITKCNGGVVTKNNTVWQGQLGRNSFSPACSLTIRPNSITKSRPSAAYDDEHATYRHHNEYENEEEFEGHYEDDCKKKAPPICQIRLDFTTLNIEQPNDQTVCHLDTFQVVGASNKVPIICGIANNQHMYLNVQKYPASDIQLLFKFEYTTSNRFWNINVAFLPCGADYLAPPGCLQYFVSSSTIKSIRSFNWVDEGVAPFISAITPISNTQEPVDPTGIKARQLANQDYKICFRKEKIFAQLASVICFTPCVTKRAKPFSLTTRAQESSGRSQSTLSECNNDFLLIPGGFNPKPTSTPIDDPLNSLDRYCGERLNPRFSALTSVTVCSRIEPFSIHYKTNGDETTSPTLDALGFGNLGFCLDYKLSTH